MNKLIKVKIDNKDIYVEAEVPEPEVGTEQKASAMDDLKELKFEDMSSTISTFCDALVKSVQKADTENKLREISVEFGLNIGIESGGLTSYIVRGTGKASVKVQVKWEL